MWTTSAYTIKMTEGDFGIQLPVTITGASFAENDAVRLTVKTKPNGVVVLEKEYTNINGGFALELTETETQSLTVGAYSYSLDWYQDGAFMCNIVRSASFVVEDKA